MNADRQAAAAEDVTPYRRSTPFTDNPDTEAWAVMSADPVLAVHNGHPHPPSTQEDTCP